MTMYHTWQGTYSACFSHGSTTRSIRPILAWNIHLDFQFGDLHLHFIIYGYAKITPFVQIGISLRIYPFVLMTIQFTWSYYDAFYWYNGAMYYTLFYSMSLFLASLLIGYQLSSSKFKKALIGGASIVLSIIIAGGNFVSGLGMGAIPFAAILIMKMGTKKMATFIYYYSHDLWHRLPFQRVGSW